MPLDQQAWAGLVAGGGGGVLAMGWVSPDYKPTYNTLWAKSIKLQLPAVTNWGTAFLFTAYKDRQTGQPSLFSHPSSTCWVPWWL